MVCDWRQGSEPGDPFACIPEFLRPLFNFLYAAFREIINTIRSILPVK